jgi:uncharacterized protein (TIGR02300 family)
MSLKAARGAKRTCQSCGSRFYDLNRDPITCPICQAIFAVEGRHAKVVEAAVVVPDEEALRAARAAIPKDFALEEPVAEGEELADISTEELAEIESADDEMAPEGEEETFIEEEDEAAAGVEDLIDSPIEGDEDEV